MTFLTGCLTQSITGVNKLIFTLEQILIPVSPFDGFRIGITLILCQFLSPCVL